MFSYGFRWSNRFYNFSRCVCLPSWGTYCVTVDKVKFLVLYSQPRVYYYRVIFIWPVLLYSVCMLINLYQRAPTIIPPKPSARHKYAINSYDQPTPPPYGLTAIALYSSNKRCAWNVDNRIIHHWFRIKLFVWISFINIGTRFIVKFPDIMWCDRHCRGPCGSSVNRFVLLWRPWRHIRGVLDGVQFGNRPFEFFLNHVYFRISSGRHLERSAHAWSYN